MQDVVALEVCMNETLKTIVGILETGRTELQVAAAQILGELRSKDSSVVRALAVASSRSSVLGRYAIEALGQIGSPEALQVVVDLLSENQMLADQAVRLLGEAGPDAHPAIAEAFASAHSENRLRMLQVLLKSPSQDSIAPMVEALCAAETCGPAALALKKRLDSLEESLQQGLCEALVGRLDQEVPDEVLSEILTVIGLLGVDDVKATVIKYTDVSCSIEVRTAALRALVGQKLTATQVKGFLEQLQDSSQAVMHEVLRETLVELPEWPSGLGPTLKKMLASRNQNQRLFALRAMRHMATPELIKVALRLRDHSDPRFREAAQEVLATSKHALEPLLRLLTLCKDPAEGRRLADMLSRLGPVAKPQQVTLIAERAIKTLASKGPSADALCDVAISMGGKKVVPFLLEKAVRWRRTKRYSEALHVLAKLATADLLDDEGLYQLALTRFLQDVNLPGEEAEPPGNAAMGFFTQLLRSDFPLLERVKKDASVSPELQLQLATYFAESVGPERRFGTDLLQMLATRNKGRTGEEARQALRSVDLV